MFLNGLKYKQNFRMCVYLGEDSLFLLLNSQKGSVEPLPPEEWRVLSVVLCFFEVVSSI